MIPSFNWENNDFDLNVLTDNWQMIPDFNWQNHVISPSLVATDRWFQILTEKIVFWPQHPY